MRSPVSFQSITWSRFESLMKTTEKSTSSRVQSSYWKHAYGIAETYKAETDSESRYVSIDKYWSKVRMLNGML